MFRGFHTCSDLHLHPHHYRSPSQHHLIARSRRDTWTDEFQADSETPSTSQPRVIEAALQMIENQRRFAHTSASSPPLERKLYTNNSSSVIYIHVRKYRSILTGTTPTTAEIYLIKVNSRRTFSSSICKEASVLCTIGFGLSARSAMRLTGLCDC